MTVALFEEAEALVARTTGNSRPEYGWHYNPELAWLSGRDEDGEIYTIANLSLDSTDDGRCYGAARNGPFLAAAPRLVRELIAHIRSTPVVHVRHHAAQTLIDRARACLAATVQRNNPGAVDIAEEHKIIAAFLRFVEPGESHVLRMREAAAQLASGNWNEAKRTELINIIVQSSRDLGDTPKED